MAKFEITLRNTKLKQYNTMAMFIVLLNIIIFMITVFYSQDQYIRNLALAGGFLSAVSLGTDVFLRKKGKEIARLRLLPLVISAVAWVLIGNAWAFVLSLVLLFMYAVSQRQLLVGVDSTAVLYPSFPRRNIRWDELNNVVLKDGLLTIDFKNDKILQSEVTESSAAVNEQEFNEFCREQLKV